MATPEYNYRQVLQRVYDKIKNALRVLVVNDLSSPVPVFVTSSAGGTPVFQSYHSTPVGSGPHTLVSATVPVGKSWSLSRVEISCRQESAIQIKRNASIIAEMRTGAAKPMANYVWNPSFPCVAGDLIEIILTKRAGIADVDVGADLMATET